MTIADLATSLYYLLNTHFIGSRKYILCMVELYVHENADLISKWDYAFVKIMEYFVCLWKCQIFTCMSHCKFAYHKVYWHQQV